VVVGSMPTAVGAFQQEAPSNGEQGSQPPATFTSGADAEQVVTELAGALPLSDATRPCLVDALGKDTALLDRARGGFTPGEPVFSELSDLLRACQQKVEFGPRLVDGINEAHGGALTESQLQCLAAAAAALTAEEMAALIGAGQVPAGSAVSQGEAVMSALLARCGVS
jgi:hypothetical protein